MTSFNTKLPDSSDPYKGPQEVKSGKVESQFNKPVQEALKFSQTQLPPSPLPAKKVSRKLESDEQSPLTERRSPLGKSVQSTVPRKQTAPFAPYAPILKSMERALCDKRIVEAKEVIWDVDQTQAENALANEKKGAFLIRPIGSYGDIVISQVKEVKNLEGKTEIEHLVFEKVNSDDKYGIYKLKTLNSREREEDQTLTEADIETIENSRNTLLQMETTPTIVKAIENSTFALSQIIVLYKQGGHMGPQGIFISPNKREKSAAVSHKSENQAPLFLRHMKEALLDKQIVRKEEVIADIDREAAENELANQIKGAFLIRPSSIDKHIVISQVQRAKTLKKEAKLAHFLVKEVNGG